MNRRKFNERVLIIWMSTSSVISVITVIALFSNNKLEINLRTSRKLIMTQISFYFILNMFQTNYIFDISHRLHKRKIIIIIISKYKMFIFLH